MNREYPDRPLIGVGVVVFRAAKVLLIRRARPPRVGQWSLPGGLQELGETVFQTAMREVREECAVEIAPRAVIDIVDSITPDDAGRVRFHYTLVEVLANWRAGDGTPSEEALETGWFDPDAVGALGMWAETQRIIALGAAMQERAPERGS